jgi:hypothetical protein
LVEDLSVTPLAPIPIDIEDRGEGERVGMIMFRRLKPTAIDNFSQQAGRWLKILASLQLIAFKRLGAKGTR